MSADVATLLYSCSPARSTLVSQRNTFCFFPFVLDELAALWTEHLNIKQTHFFETSKVMGGHCFLLYEPSLPSELSLYYTKQMMMGCFFKPDGTFTPAPPLPSSPSPSPLDVLHWTSTQTHIYFNQLTCFRHFDAALFTLTRSESIKKFLSGIGTAFVIGFNEAEASLFITGHDSRYSQKAVGRTTTSTRYGFAKISLRTQSSM